MATQCRSCAAVLPLAPSAPTWGSGQPLPWLTHFQPCRTAHCSVAPNQATNPDSLWQHTHQQSQQLLKEILSGEPSASADAFRTNSCSAVRFTAQPAAGQPPRPAAAPTLAPAAKQAPAAKAAPAPAAATQPESKSPAAAGKCKDQRCTFSVVSRALTCLARLSLLTNTRVNSPPPRSQVSTGRHGGTCCSRAQRLLAAQGRRRLAAKGRQGRGGRRRERVKDARQHVGKGLCQAQGGRGSARGRG